MRRILKRTVLALAAAVLMMAAAGCGQHQEPDTQAAQTQPLQQEQQAEQEQEKEEPEVAAPSLTAQLQQARQKNGDIVGWLRIGDTEIDGAVVQGKDNEQYKRLNEWGEYSWTGSFFADYECRFDSREDLSKNTVIYGHNIHYDDDMNGERFSQLFHFTDIDFARAHPYIYLSIKGDGEDGGEDLVWQVFSVFYTTTDFDYIRINKDFRDPAQGEISDAQLMNIITEARDRSEYDYNVPVSGTDKILTLSTCSYKYGRRKDVRFVVMAKLLEQDAPLQSAASLTVNADKKEVE